ncbi:MAG: flagellar basal body-associated FliL family protein [Gammaproteobacteria bacterium]|nr:flagellar basal body-associated FliL family protein [Gammaproteobacteria bacterium]
MAAKKEKPKEAAEVDLDAKGSNKKLIIIMSVVMLVMMGASAGITFFLFGGGGGTAAPAVEEAVVLETYYVELDTITANLIEKRPARHVQIEAQLMTFSPTVAELLKVHMPIIRNNLNILLAEPSYEQLRTPEGKEKLRKGMLEIAQKALKEQEAMDGVEAIYFTKLIMQ